MKYLKKLTLLFLFIGAFLVLSPSTTSKAATLDPKIGLEIPAGATFDRNTLMNIRGWGLNSSGIKAIDIYIDNTWKKSLVNGDGFGLSRPDVKQAYPSYPNASNSGYECNLSLSGISNDKHTLTVWAIGNDGTKTNAQILINVTSSPIVKLELDTKQKATVNQPVRLRGWALNSGAEGVDTVDIWVSEGGSSWFNHSLSVNLSRPDVAHLYPNYYNKWTCGYSGYINFSTSGIYTITAYAMKGTKQLAKTVVTVYAGIHPDPDIDPVIIKRQDVVNYAEKFVGVPYVWGGETPSGFDCSGLVEYVYAHFGVSLPRTTYAQVYSGTDITGSTLQPGDLLFFNRGSKGPEHVAIYAGNNQMVEAPHTGANVRLTSLRGDYYIVRRIFN